MSPPAPIADYQIDDLKSTTTSSGVSILAILPLLTNFATDTPPDLNISGIGVDGNSIYSESLGEYPSRYINDINGTDAGLEYSIVSTSEVNELQILENFVSGILQNSELQPDELNSYMYESIDDLLIAD